MLEKVGTVQSAQSDHGTLQQTRHLLAAGRDACIAAAGEERQNSAWLEHTAAAAVGGAAAAAGTAGQAWLWYRKEEALHCRMEEACSAVGAACRQAEGVLNAESVLAPFLTV